MDSAETDLTLYKPEFRLKINGETVPSKDVPLPVTSVSVTERLDEAGSLTIRISDPNNNWVENDLIRTGNDVELELGYRDRMIKFIKGFMEKISVNYPSSGVPQITVTVYDRTYDLGRTNPSSTTASSEEDTIGDIVKKIAQDANLTAEVDDTAGKFENYLISADKTYLDHIRVLAKKVRFNFFIRNDKLYFKKPDLEATPITSLVWGKSLISFNPTLNTTEQVNKVKVTGRRSGTGEDIEGMAEASSLQGGGGENISGSDLLGKRSGRVLQITMPVANQEEADEFAKAKLAEINDRLVTGSGSCVGDPNIRPGEILLLKNLAGRFNGNYIVTSATHGVGDGSYTTRFDVRRGVVGK